MATDDRRTIEVKIVHRPAAEAPAALGRSVPLAPAAAGTTRTPEQVEQYHTLFRHLLAAVPLGAGLVGQVDPAALARAIGDEWATEEPAVRALAAWLRGVIGST